MFTSNVLFPFNMFNQLLTNLEELAGITIFLNAKI